jgi:hypothetical protein
MTPAYRLSVALIFLMAGQSLTGLIFQTQYRDTDWIRAAWFANDWVTIAVAVPLLVAGLIRAASGSTRGTLLWLGAVSYAVYNYAYYMLGAALNAFFLVYVAAFVIAVITLILALTRLAIAELAHCFGSSTPARLAGGYLATTGMGLGTVWTVMWTAHVITGWSTPVPTEAFRLVAALDLSLMVPPLVAGGILLWRRRPWGYVIAALAGIQAALYLLVLSAGSLVAVRRGLVPSPGEVPTWATLAVATTIVTVLLLREIRRHDVSGDRHDGAAERH